jgi:formylmethanofuran dehydrogenase subunit E
LDLPQRDKRLYTFIETDGCALDGASVATGCWIGRRTMQVLDYGKIGATFVDTFTDRAIRVVPHPEVRQTVSRYTQQAEDQWHAYLEAYQVMPLDELLVVQPVRLTVSMQVIISREDARAHCDQFGEEIFNEREVHIENRVLCRACAGDSYFELMSEVHLSQEVAISIEA